MFGADIRTPFHHHREGQPPLREGRGGDQARLPHLAFPRPVASHEATGTWGVSSFIGASKLPTTFDADSNSNGSSLTNAIAICAGEEEGFILSVFGTNGALALTPGGGLTEQYENQGGVGGQSEALGVKAGSLSNPESPSYSRSSGTSRVTMASVLVV
jgi:hypothetical protein